MITIRGLPLSVENIAILKMLNRFEITIKKRYEIWENMKFWEQKTNKMTIVFNGNSEILIHCTTDQQISLEKFYLCCLSIPLWSSYQLSLTSVFQTVKNLDTIFTNAPVKNSVESVFSQVMNRDLKTASTTDCWRCSLPRKR